MVPSEVWVNLASPKHYTAHIALLAFIDKRTIHVIIQDHNDISLLRAFLVSLARNTCSTQSNELRYEAALISESGKITLALLKEVQVSQCDCKPETRVNTERFLLRFVDLNDTGQ